MDLGISLIDLMKNEPQESILRSEIFFQKIKQSQAAKFPMFFKIYISTLFKLQLNINETEALYLAEICIEEDDFNQSLIKAGLDLRLITPSRELGDLLSFPYKDYKKQPSTRERQLLEYAMNVYLQIRALDRVFNN